MNIFKSFCFLQQTVTEDDFGGGETIRKKNRNISKTIGAIAALYIKLMLFLCLDIRLRLWSRYSSVLGQKKADAI